MNRREILKYAALATGAAVSGTLTSIILSGCGSDAAEKAMADGYQPKYFSENEISNLRSLVDVILPKTDSPSASEVGVHRIMDSMVGEVYTADRQAEFRKGYTALMEHLNKTSFFNKKTEEQVQILQTLEGSKDEATKLVRDAYLDMKQQSIAYYLSNEEIGEKYLSYLPVPGKYEACITVEEAGGKLWAI
ncbi:MAG: hypothetical protein GC192_15525 [Bacteroidetes bacterium]|nr:hypothetical protein [Bacteroidota bacterium]